MKVNVTHSLETEANRLLHTLVQTANGFYFHKNFAVLPYLIKGNPAAVHLPKLAYDQISTGWQKWSNITGRIPLDYPPEWVEEILSLKPHLDEEKLSVAQKHIEDELRVHSDQILDYLTNIFPNLQKGITEIEVRVSSYGTGTSYESIELESHQKFTCSLRYDMPTDRIYSAIIHALLENTDQTFLEQNWQGKQSVSDFLMRQLENLKLTKQFTTTLYALFKLEPTLLEASHRYHNELGLKFAFPITIKRGIIYFNSTPVSPQITGTQNVILQKLIEKDGCCISYDEIASLLWSNDDQFSVWAINKHISRLNEKLRELDIALQIENKKGEGYYLANI